jgi:hypothetical protein
MSKINVRSPYFITDNSVTVFPGGSSPLASATLFLRIYEGVATTNYTSQPTYSLSATAIDGAVTFEVSELVRDYIENNFDGNYTDGTKWLNYNISRTYVNTSVAVTTQQNLAIFDGYGYFEDGANPQNDSVVLQSNDLIYTNDYANITIPVHVTENTDVTYFKDNEIIFQKILESSNNSDDIIQYVSNSALDSDAFYSRVIRDGGTIEAFSCVKDIANDFYADFDADKIQISNSSGTDIITIQEIEECKFSPYKITFVNKFGALQDLWFLKRSNLSMQTTEESYKANIVSGGTYSINSRQKTVFDKKGVERLQLNTGFYPESYNEVFRQLSLSEELWITYENNALPITLLSSELLYKTSLNDKLINYTMDVEFAFNKINNIR